MDMLTATQSYEEWLGKLMKLDRDGVRRKHEAMAADLFSFMRATYYRWAQLFPVACPLVADAPEILSVGDLHVENFGTWRDAEGRLVWGINDFDEAAKLPYSNDLVRLSLSALLALRDANQPDPVWSEASAALLVGYSDRMRRAAAEGVRKIHPIVLAETNDWLARIAMEQVRDPKKFWEHLESQLAGDPAAVSARMPEAAFKLLQKSMPKRSTEIAVKKRYAGLGSMGRPRFVAIGRWRGSRVSREIKALAPSAAWWAKVSTTKRIIYDTMLTESVRSRDPYAAAEDGWILRRLAPDCARILFASLPSTVEMNLFYAMGEETANIHLVNLKSLPAIVADLDARHGDWLAEPVHCMLAALESDHSAWRDHMSARPEHPTAERTEPEPATESRG
jgi:hypothetical protein